MNCNVLDTHRVWLFSKKRNEVSENLLSLNLMSYLVMASKLFSEFEKKIRLKYITVVNCHFTLLLRNWIIIIHQLMFFLKNCKKTRNYYQKDIKIVRLEKRQRTELSNDKLKLNVSPKTIQCQQFVSFYSIQYLSFIIHVKVGWLVGILWHINLCGLFNAKSIFM